MTALLALLALALLAVAAWRDVVTRTIPDTINLLLLVVGALGRLLEGASAFALSIGMALLLLVLLTVAFTRGLLGGGDVKIMTAVAAGLAPLNCFHFVVATAIAGGVLALAYLVLSRTSQNARTITRQSLLRRILAVEGWRIRHHGPLPYGVAIAAGGAFVLLQPGSL